MRTAAVLLLAAIASGCGDANATLAQVSQAQALSAELLVNFTKSADAGNRAVMADNDTLSVTFAREADDARATVKKDIAALEPLLQSLGYTDEPRMLQEFAAKFAEFDTLEGRILGLAVENTNLKAQRLSADAGQKAVDEFIASLDAITAKAAGPHEWQIKALAARAVSEIRAIQVLHAPHIAEPNDPPMTEIEGRMAAAHAAARRDITALAPIAGPGAKARLDTAAAALDRFMSLNAEIVTLSRRNTNVRSLVLSLEEKRALVAACENSARALRAALAKRSYSAGR